MQIFKMLFESNVKRVSCRQVTFTHQPSHIDDKIINVLYNVFTSNKNCVISIKDSRQSSETTNLLAYAMTYIQTHNKPVIFIVNNTVIANILTREIGNINFLMFKTPNQFDIAICGRKDVGLVIVDSQVSNVSDIIKHSCALKDTQFVISTDESNIRFI